MRLIKSNLVRRTSLLKATAFAALLTATTVAPMMASITTRAVTDCSPNGIRYAGSSWLGGGGVNVCNTPGDNSNNYVNNINGASTLTGTKWQCVEMVNRLYLTRGWTTAFWTGNGGGNSGLVYHVPSSLTAEMNGSVTYINPGDVITLSNRDNPSGPGHAAVIDTVGGTIGIVNQNAQSVSSSASLSSGTVSMAAGTWTNYTVQAVIHAPSGPNLGQMGPNAPRDDFVIWRLMNTYDGTWYARRNENNTATTLAVDGWVHGSPGDIPLTADFNKDKIADMVIYRSGTWYVEDGASPHGHLAIWGAIFGQAGDIPVVGDFTGDGYADFGVWRIVNSTGTWYILNGTNGQPTPIWGAQHGSPGDVPVVGDFNGDHIADFGIYRNVGGTGYWYFKSGATGQPISSAWGVAHGGWSQDIPVVGDFDGDGYADFAIYRPIGGTGYWYVRSGVNVGNMFINGAMQGGWTGDIPLAGNFG